MKTELELIGWGQRLRLRLECISIARNMHTYISYWLGSTRCISCKVVNFYLTDRFFLYFVLY